MQRLTNSPSSLKRTPGVRKNEQVRFHGAFTDEAVVMEDRHTRWEG